MKVVDSQKQVVHNDSSGVHVKQSAELGKVAVERLQPPSGKDTQNDQLQPPSGKDTQNDQLKVSYTCSTYCFVCVCCLTV